MIAENNLPDVMLVSGPEEVEELAEYGMIEDLSDSYQEATSSRIKSMYSSYGKELLESVTIDGKLMALPSTQVYYGCNLFWVREDWRKELGLPEPSTLADVEQIIQAFRENDPGGNGNIGLPLCGNTVWRRFFKFFCRSCFCRISCISGYMATGWGLTVMSMDH